MNDSSRKTFSKTLILMSIPVAIQELLRNSLSFIDTLMIGKLGEMSIAAVGIGSQIFFLVYVVLFGISSGCSIFMSQFWGSKDVDGFSKTTALALISGVFFSSIFAFLSIFSPSFIVSLFVSNESVKAIACEYLVWTGISFVFTAISLVFNCLMRSTCDAKTPMYVTFASMFADVVLNYLLIFKANLGVKGAAIATTISRLLETVLLLAFFYYKPVVKINYSNAFKFDGKFTLSVLKTSLPVLVDDGLWALGLTVYKIIYAHMGVDILACVNVIGTIENLFFVLQNGLGAATAVLIGNSIGSGKSDDAYEEARICNRYGFILGISIGLVMFALKSYLPPLFGLSAWVNSITVKSMIAIAVLMPLKQHNHINVVGIFRSGGDTRFILYLEIISIWIIGVPFTFLSGLVWKMPIYIVYYFTGLEELFKTLVMIPRFKSKKWIHNLVS